MCRHKIKLVLINLRYLKAYEACHSQDIRKLGEKNPKPEALNPKS